MRERIGCGDFAQVQNDPEALKISLARATTIGLVRKYFALSVEMGRLPSVLGREVFRAKCSSYMLETFEDTVIFVLDMERCLEELDANSQMLIALLTMEELRMDEVADRLNVALRQVMRAYGNALDTLTRVLIERCMMRKGVGRSVVVLADDYAGRARRPSPPMTGSEAVEKSCQGSFGGRFFVS